MFAFNAARGESGDCCLSAGRGRCGTGVVSLPVSSAEVGSVVEDDIVDDTLPSRFLLDVLAVLKGEGGTGACAIAAAAVTRDTRGVL